MGSPKNRKLIDPVDPTQTISAKLLWQVVMFYMFTSTAYLSKTDIHKQDDPKSFKMKFLFSSNCKAFN